MKVRFEPGDACAIAPKAHGALFDVAPIEPNDPKGASIVVKVRGALMHHPHPCFDSYDAIKSRVADALTLHPRCVILSIDSPGGLVSGAFDTANDIASMCEAVGVDLYAYVDGQAASAAYGLASVADVIVTPPTAEIGSIGAISEAVSVAKLNAAMGIERVIITSGERKADGNPNAPLTDAAIAAIRDRVVKFGALFAQHVADHRGLSVEDVIAMQAGILVGADAVSAGLADEVMTEDQMHAAIASGTFAASGAAESKEIETMPTATKAEDDKKENPFSKAKAKEYLKALAEDESQPDEDRASARKALAAMDDDEAKAEDKGDEKEPDGDEAKSSAVAKLIAKAIAPIQAHLARKDAEEAKAKAADESAERARLIASRPDFDAPTAAAAAALPIDALREFAKNAPKRALPKAAATAVVPTTRAAGQTDTRAPSEVRAYRQSAHDARAMRVVMGMEAPTEEGQMVIHPSGNAAALIQPNKINPNEFDPRLLTRIAEPAA